MMELLDMESDDVLFVGIHGMGGVGKTTLAEIIYDRVSNSYCRFEGSSFISCIREKSTTARDQAFLQKELISTIMQEEIHVWDYHQGIRMIMKMLQNKRVFIVLDDVDSDEQLTALAGDRKWFGPGSRVIITCRDSHLLRTHEVNDIYKVEQLGIEKALQLFSLSAFKKTHRTENYMDLSKHFVKYAQGLPLALKVLGSFLFGRTIDAWESARDQLEAIPNRKIMDVLQISFDGLQELQRELFLDVACFFGRQDIFSEIMLERFDHYHIDMDVLVEKSLISKSKYGWLSMHDLLKELGKEIVRRECPEEPGRRSRLFRVDDLYHVLKNDTGTDAAKAIVVDFCPKTKDQVLNAKAFSKMGKLRYLKFHGSRNNLKWRGNPLKYMPTNELRYLELPGYHSKSLPSSFQPENLTVLRMRGSRIKQLWKGSMVLDNLKVFDLSHSKNLIETPDLTGVPNLERIYLKGCRSLCEVHPSIGSLKRLKALELEKCSSLEKLPDLSSLERMTYLSAGRTAITQMPSVNLRPKSIRHLWFFLQGRKLMRLKSREPIYDIGSLVEYQKDGTYDHLEAAWIDFDSKGENILDMAGGVVSAIDDNLNMISGWSLGFHIPEWVQYKSNGSSVKIDLDAHTNPEMGFAFFIVCDSDQFKSWSKYSTAVGLTIVFATDEEYNVEYDCSHYRLIPTIWNVSLRKQIGFWVYIPVVLRFLDIRRVIKISFKTGWRRYLANSLVKEEVEVKECGVHLVCPDDANSKFYNSIAPLGRSGSSNSYFHRRFFASIRKNEKDVMFFLRRKWDWDWD
ncbi:disease resistance protein RUN1-like [Juglans microcarpa x Juglans regia]|uniref:disease resistance protein RUN1-like n=1 Tax=Juglans microcarpa x Juglans regia TaxID=2249226 RepID=UPI001B7E15B8|nr:disease resistance protein RUN1-like [Juglans microcarpa x Juglans regia]